MIIFYEAAAGVEVGVPEVEDGSIFGFQLRRPRCDGKTKRRNWVIGKKHGRSVGKAREVW